MKWSGIVLGEKPSKSDDGEKSEEKSSGDFGGEGLGMAVRAFAKALGVDADAIDMPKAVKAFKAACVACDSDDDMELSEEDED